MSYTIVADENIPDVERYFAAMGHVTRVNGRLLTRQQLAQADILLLRSVTRVDQSLLAGSPVRFVGSATIGTDHLDTAYLEKQGIAWANAPGCNADSVVEYVLSAFARVEGLLEKLLLDGGRVGIVGMGNVGSGLYRRLDALGIDCVAYDPLLPRQRYSVLSDFDTVLDADVVCLHAPLTREGAHPSYHLLDQSRLLQLREEAVLLNAGRGAVIDNAALSHCMTVRPGLKVILDVWEHEPAINQQLMAQVLLATPHIAGYSLDGKRAGTAMIHQACCQALALPVAVPPLAGEQTPPIHLTVGGVAGLRQAILHCYDVAADDQRMRQALAAAEGDCRASAFDRLRKDYPVRREFFHYRIANVERLDRPLRAYLKAARFTLTESSES